MDVALVEAVLELHVLPVVHLVPLGGVVEEDGLVVRRDDVDQASPTVSSVQKITSGVQHTCVIDDFGLIMISILNQELITMVVGSML